MTIENEKIIGGLSCTDVLARLSDYVDGELAADERAAVEAHLRACDGCARFGGDFRATVRVLQVELARGGEIPESVREGLRRALDAEPRRR